MKYVYKIKVVDEVNDFKEDIDDFLCFFVRVKIDRIFLNDVRY